MKTLWSLGLLLLLLSGCETIAPGMQFSPYRPGDNTVYVLVEDQTPGALEGWATIFKLKNDVLAGLTVGTYDLPLLYPTQATCESAREKQWSYGSIIGSLVRGQYKAESSPCKRVFYLVEGKGTSVPETGAREILVKKK